MCRLLGIVSLSPYDFQLMLCRAPRSLALLSREHRDGWGVALHAGTPGAEWVLERSTESAAADPVFSSLARREHGRILIAHVRQKTVGELSPDNTHPFQSGPWVFAHNGTIKNTREIRRRTSGVRLAELRGDTDSELFFAYLLSKLDEAGVAGGPVGPATDRAIRDAVLEAVALDEFGTLDALLSNGQSLYAMRFGRPLYFLERRPSERAIDDELDVPLTRRHCLLVASEPLTDERWMLLEHGALLRLDPAPEPQVTTL
ncbi:MAG: class II glutamine amidotransferase [Myxococcales bacterium]|nr:class II glutamine amidotransferase [Myxococcales bacterium]